jgi:PhnB protein
MNTACVGDEVREGEYPAALERVGRAPSIWSVRDRNDGSAVQRRHRLRRDDVGARTGDEDVAVDLEERRARMGGDGPLLDELVTVPSAEGEKLVDVETLRIDQRPFDRADRDDARTGANAGSGGAGAGLPESLDRDRRVHQGFSELLECDRGGTPDPVADGEVVHPHSLVLSHPHGFRLAMAQGEEVLRLRSHVGPGEKELAQLADALEVGVENCRAITSCKADSGLRARIRKAGDGELPGHRSCKTGELVGGHVGGHPRPAGSDREEIVVDHDDRVEPDGRLLDLENPRGRRVLPFIEGQRAHLQNPTSARDSVPDAMTSIQPELWVETPREAVAFYEAAFGATVLHRVGEGEDIVAQLAVGDAAFWIAGASTTMKRFSPRAIDGATGRTLLVVQDPDTVVRRAVAAGATEISHVNNEHGWRVGRIVDPFGHEWEIGVPLGAWPPK